MNVFREKFWCYVMGRNAWDGGDTCTWCRLLLAVNFAAMSNNKGRSLIESRLEESAFEMSNAYLWETDLFFYGNTASLVSGAICSLTRTI